MNEWNKRNALRMLLYAVLYAVVTASAAFSLCFLISLRSAISSPFTAFSQIQQIPLLFFI